VWPLADTSCLTRKRPCGAKRTIADNIGRKKRHEVLRMERQHSVLQAKKIDSVQAKACFIKKARSVCFL
jgi:hypothetical protein